MTNREECPIRNEYGNCLCVGGFCTAVNDEICQSVKQAYSWGVYKGIDTIRQAQEPRLMTLDEVKKGDEPVIFESEKYTCWGVRLYNALIGVRFALRYGDVGLVETFPYAEYGKRWRCWTTKEKLAERFKDTVIKQKNSAIE